VLRLGFGNGYSPRSFAPHRASKVGLLIAPEFYYIEVVFTADARGKIHRQFFAALLDLHVIS
jgi:hypothetical protein